jgi:amino acid transporter/nucleotide-binding universal stress UspA family protein
MIAFLLNGIINVITAMTYAELGSAYPEAGGGYLWVRKGLPPPFGFVSGWISWFGHTVACALYALGFGTYLEWLLETYLVNPIPHDFFLGTDKIIAVIVAIILLYINYRGTASTGKSENIFTVSKIIILGIFIAAGGVAMVHNPKAIDNLFGTFFPEGGGGVLYAMGLTLIAFQGYEVIAQTGEEVENPKKNIPRAIFISMFVVVLIYILMVIILFGIITEDMMVVDGRAILPHEYLGGTAGSEEGGEVALVKIAEATMGVWGAVLILIGGFLSTLSALNATVFSSSRVAFAMGRDGTLPKKLGAIHSKRRTPHNAIAFSGLILIIMVVFFPIETVAGSADVMFLILFAITNAAGISLRYKMPELDRGFKVPLFPVLPIIAIILNLALIYPIFMIEPMAFYIGIIWILIGAYIYRFTGAEKAILERPMEMEEMPKAISKEKWDRYRVLVPCKMAADRPLVEFASIMAKEGGGDLSLLNIIEIPKATPASAVGFLDVQDQIKQMEQLERIGKKHHVDTDAKLLISGEVAPTIVDISRREDIEMIVLGWQGFSKLGTVMGTNLDRIVANADADVVVFKIAGLKKEVKNITLLHGHGWHVSHAAKLAARYAKRFDAKVTVLHVCDQEVSTEEDRNQLATLEKIIKDEGAHVDTQFVHNPDIVMGVVDNTATSDLLFMGAADLGMFGRTLFGDLPDRIAKFVRCPVAMVKKVAEEKPIEGIDMVE